MFRSLDRYRLVAALLALALVFPGAGFAGAIKSQSPKSATPKTPAKKRTAKKRPSWFVPTFADSTKDDIAEFDDPVVRQVAVEALGRHNGSVVAVDPNSGRILSVVNQRLAFSAGFQPCSTIKPVVG